MEDVPYNMAKRYAEIMKTMWFTFFYAPAIPIGIVWSAVGIVLYYWVDKALILRFLFSNSAFRMLFSGSSV